jgi:type 1 glutamine amidotransferase
MNRFSRLALIAASVALAAPAPAGDASPLPRKKILFFSKSADFEHSVVVRRNGNPAFAEQVLRELGAKNNLEFTFSKDGSLFTPEYLDRFDVIFFYTTGDLTESGTDRNPPMPPSGKTALLQAIEHGKGFVGVHCASDTFHSPGNQALNVPARNQSDGDRADPYIRMLGGEFIKHGAQQKSRLIVADSRFPGLSAVPADFGPTEEWYSLKNFAPDLHVLLVQDTTGMTGAEYARPPYPSTWARRQGRGRVFYTSMGHREDVWLNPVFQAVLLGGLNWTSGRVEADVTPNIDRVARGANTLPTFVAPPQKQ